MVLYQLRTITYPSLGEDGLLSAERAGDGEALRGQVHREAVEAEGVQAGENLKKKTHETEAHLSLLSILQHVRYGGHFDNDAASVHKANFEVTFHVG